MLENATLIIVVVLCQSFLMQLLLISCVFVLLHVSLLIYTHMRIL